MNSTSGRLGNVQLLRGIAALMVVVLHSVGRAIRAETEIGPFGPFDPWGNAGVDLFFVISGFIMVHIHERRPRSPWRFLADRAARIVPLYWLILSLVVVMTLYGPLNMWDAGPGQPWTSFLFLSQALSDSRPILFLGWPLEYEAFFSCCFAVAIAIAGKSEGRIDPLLPLAALIAVPVAAGMGYPIAIEFLFGALVARVLPHVPAARASMIGWGALAVGAAGLLAQVIQFLQALQMFVNQRIETQMSATKGLAVGREYQHVFR